MSASGSSSSSAGPMIPPVNQKTQLINVREFKQTYEDLIKKKTQIRVEERQELNAASHNFQQPNPGRNNLQQPNPGRHFQDPGRFLLNTQEQWNLYDCADLLIPTPYDIIEQSIKEQIEKTKVNDNNYSGNPSKIAEETGLGLGEIVTISHIEQMQQSNLLSLTETGKQENGLMLPRKEMNYVTKHLLECGKNKHIPKPIPPFEVLLKVALYHPEKNLKTQEFAVFGSQKLTELRDSFYCLSDFIINGKNTKSGYFFVEGTFYCDMRDPKNIDYSKPILEWAQKEERQKQSAFQNLSTRRMEDTTFYDLSLRVGERYLYCHQGDCMHYIIFTEVRLINDEDNQNYNAYPIRVFQSKVRRRKCCICEIYPAKYVTYRDKLSSEEPTFYCDACYRQFHYNSDGNLLFEDYEVYRYLHE